MEGQVSGKLKVFLLVAALLLIVLLTYLVWRNNDYISNLGVEVAEAPIKTATATKTATAVATKTAAPTATATQAAWQTYTEKTCGFTLTFTDKWVGYKMKEAAVGGITTTYYVNVPTTDVDTIWTTEDSTHFAKYASVFAIGIYTQAQWTSAQDEPNKPAKMGECGNYIVGYTPSQALPMDIQDKNLASEVKAIVATFKAT